MADGVSGVLAALVFCQSKDHRKVGKNKRHSQCIQNRKRKLAIKTLKQVMCKMSGTRDGLFTYKKKKKQKKGNTRS